MNIRHITIIGDGNLGSATAVDLADKGYKVHIFDIDHIALNAIRELGGIHAKGEAQGYFPIQVSYDLSEVIPQTDLLMTCIPASTHRSFARTLAPLLNNKEPPWILIQPGQSFSAFEIHHLLRQEGISAPSHPHRNPQYPLHLSTYKPWSRRDLR